MISKIPSQLFDISWSSFVESLVKTSVPLLVELQLSWASDTSNCNSFPASNILSFVIWVSNVATVIGAEMGTFVWTFKGCGWLPFLCSDTLVVFAVETLVAILTELQFQRPTCLTVG